MAQADLVEILARPVAVPDIDPLLSQFPAVGTAADEPEELLDHAPDKDALGREKGEGAVGEAEAEGGRSEEGKGAGAGAVGAALAGRNDARDQVEVLVLLYGVSMSGSSKSS